MDDPTNKDESMGANQNFMGDTGANQKNSPELSRAIMDI